MTLGVASMGRAKHLDLQMKSLLSSSLKEVWQFPIMVRDTN